MLLILLCTFGVAIKSSAAVFTSGGSKVLLMLLTITANVIVAMTASARLVSVPCFRFRSSLVYRLQAAN